jgi:hypothetical protein
MAVLLTIIVALTRSVVNLLEVLVLDLGLDVDLVNAHDEGDLRGLVGCAVEPDGHDLVRDVLAVENDRALALGIDR